MYLSLRVITQLLYNYHSSRMNVLRQTTRKHREISRRDVRGTVSALSFPAATSFLRRYLSPRECQFRLRYTVIFMTSRRAAEAGINESCRITLTLVLRRTGTCFSCAATTPREREYILSVFLLRRLSRLPPFCTKCAGLSSGNY